MLLLWQMQWWLQKNKILLMRHTLYIVLFFVSVSIAAQNKGYWQQEVSYTMDIDVDVEEYQYKGQQNLVYKNNSPDTLTKVYYHLYFNAFQPNSEMDIRLQNVPDPDPRMVNRLGTEEEPLYESKIAVLKPDEVGYIQVQSMTQNGKPLQYHVEGTVLEVLLEKPIKPGKKAIFDMVFEAQIPLQIRRSGRNNEEGVALSMSQWYPKMAEYDFEGWHTDAYIGREFFGVWGDFDVTIHLDKNYVVGSTGYIQNPQEVGYGYEKPSKKLKLPEGNKLTWHFKGENIHDFSWAADPEFQHDIVVLDNEVKLHFLYKKSMEEKYLQNWKNLQEKTVELMRFYNKRIGEYPYKQYSVIQAGDGGMEYAMCTFVTGQRNFGSLVGVVAHEMAHSWFQFVLATNEIKYPWMDEGFTTYISNIAEANVFEREESEANNGAYSSYYGILQYDIEEPLSTMADCYAYNYAYGIGSYSKGALFLAQLEYVVGEEAVKRALRKYYSKFKFTHPVPNDIVRILEKESGISLDWYLYHWTQTTNAIDYAVEVFNSNEIQINRVGKMPMPIEFSVKYTDGTMEVFYIPLTMMRGQKETNATVLKDWSWVSKKYHFSTEKEILSVQIDPSNKMADVDKENNVFPVKSEE